MKLRIYFCVAATTLFTLSATCQPASTSSISFQGALTGANGQPLTNGNYRLTFKFYDTPVSGTPTGTSILTNVPVVGGVASVAVPVDPAWFDGSTRYLGISIDASNNGQELSPRVLVTAVPYAMRALSVSDPYGQISFGTGALLHQDQGGSIELGDSLRPGARPFIDFHHGTGQTEDFNVRLINDADRLLTIYSDVDDVNVQIRGDLEVTGTARATVLQITSDKNAKEAFTAVNPRMILTKVTTLPIATWRYKQSTNALHMGPVAQDFLAAFGLGDSDKHIATIDADGVAFAAIQGLHQLVQEKEAQLLILEKRLQALERKSSQIQE